MVFFCCQVCQESLKRAQIPRHAYSCRGAYYFDCVDCGKTFDAQSSKSHSQCSSAVCEKKVTKKDERTSKDVNSDLQKGKSAKEKKGKTEKFKWRKVISRHLKDREGKMMRIEDLRQAVISEFNQLGVKRKREEDLERIFDEKLKKIGVMYVKLED